MRLRRPARLVHIGLTLGLLTISAPAPAAEPGDAAQLFERFKALEGSWQAESTVGWNEVSTFEVIAAGSVVMATTSFRDAPENKMITMVYLDGAELVAVHYCEAGNQPALRATELDAGTGTVTFAFAGGGNIPTRDHGHMDTAIYRFIDDDSFASRWTWFQEGEEQWLEDIEYRRIGALGVDAQGSE